MGIGFAIPANMVRTVISAAKRGGTMVKRPWLGATLQSVTHEIAESLGLERSTGALVTEVLPKSPAQEAGLKSGDIVESIDGVAVDDPEALGYRLATRPLGGVASLGVLRGGKSLITPLTLMSAPETPSRDELKLSGNSPFSGATAVNISPAVTEEMGGVAADKGVVISDVAEDSQAAAVNFQKGDVIIAVNDTKIATTADLKRVSVTRPGYWKLSVGRGGQVLTTVVGG